MLRSSVGVYVVLFGFWVVLLVGFVEMSVEESVFVGWFVEGLVEL